MEEKNGADGEGEEEFRGEIVVAEVEIGSVGDEDVQAEEEDVNDAAEEGEEGTNAGKKGNCQNSGQRHEQIPENVKPLSDDFDLLLGGCGQSEAFLVRAQRVGHAKNTAD